MSTIITDTKAQAALNPKNVLVEALVEGSSNFIQGQERRGQQELVNSICLPTDGTKGKDAEVWERMGIVLGDPDSDDPMFRPAQLPFGWKKVATDHDMWSRLVDDKGRERAAMFYKAAFYDRSAHIRPTQRFSIRQCYDLPERVVATRMVYDVRDGDRVVYRVVQAMPDKRRNSRAYYTEAEKVEPRLREDCVNWLTEHCPQWQDPMASWDAPDMEAIEDLTVETDALPMYRVGQDYDYDSPVCHYRVFEDGVEIHLETEKYPTEQDLAPRKVTFCPYRGVYEEDGYYNTGRARQVALKEDLEDARQKTRQKLYKRCLEWLDQNRPGWKKNEIR